MEMSYYERQNNNIDKEPKFAWWVPSALKHRNVMISKAAMRVMKNMKFGIAIPDTYDEAVKLNRINVNTYWQE